MLPKRNSSIESLELFRNNGKNFKAKPSPVVKYMSLPKQYNSGIKSALKLPVHSMLESKSSS